MNFKQGQKVRWHDPALYRDFEEWEWEEMLARVFLIHDVDNHRGVAYIVEEGGGSEAEVYTDELEPI